MCVYIYICTYVYQYMYTYLYPFVYIRIHIYTQRLSGVLIRIYTYLYEYIHMYLYICACMYVCKYIHVHMYMYICTKIIGHTTRPRMEKSHSKMTCVFIFNTLKLTLKNVARKMPLFQLIKLSWHRVVKMHHMPSFGGLFPRKIH